MIIKAIDKITNEMMASNGNGAVIYIEEHLRDKITSEEVAAKILEEGKTIAGALGEMKKVAKERAVGGVGFIPPEEGLRIVDKYFGLDEVEKPAKEPAPVKEAEPVNVLDFL